MGNQRGIRLGVIGRTLTALLSVGWISFLTHSLVEDSRNVAPLSLTQVGASTQGLLLGTSRSSEALSKAQIAAAIGSPPTLDAFPEELDLSFTGRAPRPLRVSYTFDRPLQQYMEQLFSEYRPDYGSFVALEARSGRILCLVSYARDAPLLENLALRASFPSASVFKIVTAAAAVENRQLSGDTVLSYSGRKHTLYRGQILESRITRWTRHITLRDAFSHSINTIFGRLGAFTLGPNFLKTTAEAFGFNRQIVSDLTLQPGRASIPEDPEDAWGLAESASGFTRENTMSPLQGALIAAAVANDGVMMEPYAVESLRDPSGRSLYNNAVQVAAVSTQPSTAREVRSMMQKTVRFGTPRGSFKGFFRGTTANIEVGGKTGSLTGFDPPGKYDWFVGYAHAGTEHLAFASLTVHQKQWRVKSAYLARRAIEYHFGSKQGPNLLQRRPARHLARRRFQSKPLAVDTSKTGEPLE